MEKSPLTQNKSTDELFAEPLGEIAGFRFDESVASVFPDMLKRSIPGYHSIIAQSGSLAQRFSQSGSNCIDLGCSLGATLLAMRQSINNHSCNLIGVDNSPAMIQRCEELIKLDNDYHPDRAQRLKVQLRCEAIERTEITNASVVALNFTLQFIRPDARESLLQRIHAGMQTGGVLILSEKIAFRNPTMHDLFIDRYHAFKKANGYSDLEISQKRTALENVLIPDTIETHEQRLSNAGFKHCSVWFQCFNFISMIAIK